MAVTGLMFIKFYNVTENAVVEVSDAKRDILARKNVIWNRDKKTEYCRMARFDNIETLIRALPNFLRTR